MKFYITILISSLLLIQCKSTKDLDQADPFVISFGSFGGFAGSFTEYLIFHNGQVNKRSRLNGPLTEMAPVNKEVYDESLEILDNLQREHIVLDDPGNMSYFIKVFRNNESIYELVWSNPDLPDFRSVKSLYDRLNNLCKDNNPKM